MNRVILKGNAGKDTELRSTSTGKAVASVNLATSKKYKNSKGDIVEETEWHNLEFWNKSAEAAAKYVKKGATVYLEGSNKTESYEKDGITRYRTKVVVESFTVLKYVGDKPATQGAAPVQNEVAASVGSDFVPDSTGSDDLPF